MKFIIRRTSKWDDTKPCKEAVPCMVKHIDRRTFKSPEEHDIQLSNHKKWLEEGTEHKVYRGGISRRVEDISAWCVEINTLEELMKFYSKYGSLIIESNMWSGDPGIEIYDGYRE